MTEPTRTGVKLVWRERQAWERIQHLAETAQKMLEDSSTGDLATQLIPTVRSEVDRLNQLAKTVALKPEENNTHD